MVGTISLLFYVSIRFVEAVAGGKCVGNKEEEEEEGGGWTADVYYADCC